MFELNNIITDFLDVCKLAQEPIDISDLRIEILVAGEKHNCLKLPKGEIAIYIFLDKNFTECYKVGKVGENSNARFQFQHYLPNSTKSNLAKSILADNGILDVDEENVGNWIKKNTTRVNIFIIKEKGIRILNLMESFFQLRLNPKYEGFKSQRDYKNVC